MRLSALL